MAQHFDVSLKLMFRRSDGIVTRTVFGGPVVEWLNVELPEVRNPRVDLLARDGAGRLHHLELESTNDGAMPRRLAEYHLGLHRALNEDVEMNVLYVGKEPLRNVGEFRTRSMEFRFRLIDMSELDGLPLIESEDLGDNMLALLTRCDRELVLRTVETTIGLLPHGLREESARLFMILSGLRGLAPTVRRRFSMMIDLMENEVFAEEILKAEAKMLLNLIQARFGAVPPWVFEKFEGAKEEQYLAWGRRLLTADSLDAVFE